jgi:hypothetical protein
MISVKDKRKNTKEKVKSRKEKVKSRKGKGYPAHAHSTLH